LAVAVGLALLLFGLVMLVLPGPGMPFVLLALAILAAHFVWASRCLRALRHGWSRGVQASGRTHEQRRRKVLTALAVVFRAITPARQRSRATPMAARPAGDQ
jgi:uncharacterized protein (TIGR02611 family)